MPVLERRRERERLERAAGLAVALRGEVELQPLAARHAHRHRAHLPVARVDRDERGGRVAPSWRMRRDRLRWRASAAAGRSSSCTRRPPLSTSRGPKLRDELVGHVAEEVRLVDRPVEAARAAAAAAACSAQRAGACVRSRRREHRLAAPGRGGRARRSGCAAGRRRSAPAAARRSAPPAASVSCDARFEKYVCAAASTP